MTGDAVRHSCGANDDLWKVLNLPVPWKGTWWSGRVLRSCTCWLGAWEAEWCSLSMYVAPLVRSSDRKASMLLLTLPFYQITSGVAENEQHV